MWNVCLNDYYCLMISHYLIFNCMYYYDDMNEMQLWFAWGCELRLMDSYVSYLLSFLDCI